MMGAAWTSLRRSNNNDPMHRAIITGYGNIATAVKAIKLGAVDYLTKPVDADDIVSALLAPLGGKAEAPQHPMSPANVRLQHIQQVHEASGRNVSETARRLNMHRRTLQAVEGLGVKGLVQTPGGVVTVFRLRPK